MGAANVGAVFITWPGHISQRSLLVLLAMAHLSLDTAREGQPARRYFAGPGYLAEVLYGAEGIEHARGGEATPTPSAGRQVRKCLTELERAGAIRRVVKGAPGRRSEYEVVLTVATPRTAEVRQQGTAEVPNRGPQRSAERTAEVPLRNHEDYQEHQEEKITTSVPSPTPALAAGEQGWSDVALVTEKVTGEHYVSANGFLERTVGTARAGDLTADYLVAHPDAGYMDAVVNVARDGGWLA